MKQKAFKSGNVICVIGRQGSGKTPVIKRLIESSNYRRVIVYDVRREYPEKYALFYSLHLFKKYVMQAKDSFIVCEEATGFINSFKSLEFTDFLIGVQHNRNTIIFVFHSLMDAPQYILRLTRFVVLLKTNDDAEIIKHSRPKFYPYMNKENDTYIDIHNL